MGDELAVVDASAIASLLFGEPQGAEVATALEDRQLIAPTLLRDELASVCLKKRQLYPAAKETLLQALGFLDRLRLREVGVVDRKVIELAERKHLTYYDACYLWLARELEADLVSLDSRLREAWEV
jgi:predicted nucleic acid-binding protein